MNKNPLNKGMIEKNSVGIGEISTEMVNERAKELALIAGRTVTTEDDHQALDELTGGDEIDATKASLGALPEDERWAPVAGSTGHEVAKFTNEDEGADGQSESAQLYEEGVREAAHDQMLQAAITAAAKRVTDP